MNNKILLTLIVNKLHCSALKNSLCPYINCMVVARFPLKISIMAEKLHQKNARFELNMSKWKSRSLKIFFVLAFLVFFNGIFFSIVFSQLVSGRNPDEQMEPAINFTPVKSSNYLLGITYTWLEDYKVIGSAITSDSEGNSFITGTISVDLLAKTDIFLGKINSTGDFEWLKQWDYQEQDIANDIVIDESRNQVFVIGETLLNASFGYSDILVVCFDTDTGNELWNATYGELNLSEEGNSAIYYSSKLYITGTQTTFFHLYSAPNIFSACIDSLNSSLLWMNNSTDSAFDFSPTIIINENQEELFLVFNRYLKLTNEKIYRFHVRNLKLNGTQIWESVYGIDKSIKINDAIFLNSTNEIKLAGQVNEENNPTSKDAILLTLNTTGEIILETKIGDADFNDYALSVAAKDDILFIGGFGESKLKSNQACMLSKIDSTGEVFWFEKIDYYAISSFNDLSINSQNELLAIGSCKYNYDYIFERMLLAITKDSDSDGLCDSFELEIGTDPENPDSDSDGYKDGDEYHSYTDPLKSSSNPRTRLFLRNLAIFLFILLISCFLIIHFSINTFSRKTDSSEKSAVVKLYEKIKCKLAIKKRKKNG